MRRVTCFPVPFWFDSEIEFHTRKDVIVCLAFMTLHWWKFATRAQTLMNTCVLDHLRVRCSQIQNKSTFLCHDQSGMIWSNFSDLTRPISPQKVAFRKGNGTPAISGKSRLVKYNNLVRSMWVFPKIMVPPNYPFYIYI